MQLPWTRKRNSSPDFRTLLVMCTICLVSFTAFSYHTFSAVLRALVWKVAVLIKFCNYFWLNLVLYLFCHSSVSPCLTGCSIMWPLTPLRFISDHALYDENVLFWSVPPHLKFCSIFFFHPMFPWNIYNLQLNYEILLSYDFF